MYLSQENSVALEPCHPKMKESKNWSAVMKKQTTDYW